MLQPALTTGSEDVPHDGEVITTPGVSENQPGHTDGGGCGSDSLEHGMTLRERTGQVSDNRASPWGPGGPSVMK